MSQMTCIMRNNQLLSSRVKYAGFCCSCDQSWTQTAQMKYTVCKHQIWSVSQSVNQSVNHHGHQQQQQLCQVTPSRVQNTVPSCWYFSFCAGLCRSIRWFVANSSSSNTIWLPLINEDCFLFTRHLRLWLHHATHLLLSMTWLAHNHIHLVLGTALAVEKEVHVQSWESWPSWTALETCKLCKHITYCFKMVTITNTVSSHSCRCFVQHKFSLLTTDRSFLWTNTITLATPNQGKMYASTVPFMGDNETAIELVHEEKGWEVKRIFAEISKQQVVLASHW